MMNPTDQFKLSAEGFEDAWRGAKRMVATMVVEAKEMLMPHLLVETVTFPEGVRASDGFVLPFRNDEEKRELLEQAGRYVYSRQELPVAIFFSCETWSSAQSVQSGLSPMECADRIERVMLVGQTLDRKIMRLSCAEIRHETGKRKVGALDDQDGEFRFDVLNHFWRGFFTRSFDVTQKSVKE